MFVAAFRNPFMALRNLFGLMKNTNGLLSIIGLDAYPNIHVGNIIEGNILILRRFFRWHDDACGH